MARTFLSKRLLKVIILLLLLNSNQLLAQLVAVTTTADNGNDISPIPSSLRAAILAVNTGNYDEIFFAIPQTEGNFSDPTKSPFKIVPHINVLPAITKKCTMDGNTQNRYSYTGLEPTIEINGTDLSTQNNGWGLSLQSNEVITVRGFTICDFKVGAMAVLISGSNCILENNVLYNAGTAVWMMGCSNVKIRGNIIGRNRTSPVSKNPPGSAGEIDGILLLLGANNNEIGGSTAGNENIITNCNSGIRCGFNLEIPPYSIQNKITKNYFYSNHLNIWLFNHGNNMHPRPTISLCNPDKVSGKATAGDKVEVFLSTPNTVYGEDAVTYLGTAVAAIPGGDWSLTGLSLAYGNRVSATTTDLQNNTSEFSPAALVTGPCQYVQQDQTAKIELLSPINEAQVPLTGTQLSYKINSVPALETTVYTLRLEIAPPTTEAATGRVIPDWTKAKGFNTPSGTTLSAGTFNALLSNYLTANPLAMNYFWRVGIQYQAPLSTGFQPVLWSAVKQFTVVPVVADLPAAAYLTDNTLHTNNINWVYGISYLDDGATSEGIAYVDGLGKSRQVQSKMNSTNTIMAIEAVYSEEGGGTVMTLPAPIRNSGGIQRFGYAYRFFDVLDGSTLRDFSTQDFDREIKATQALITPTPVDQSADGTVGKYYSSNNSAEPYVDDAKGFPYAYSVGYKSPLQRPMLGAAGVGEDFKITTRANQYFYGKPSQEELERVYGVTKAPEADKIAKTTVYNTDGVGNISYTDNEGKLIATALTVCSANAPSLKPLVEDGMDGFTVHVDAINTDKLDETSLVRTSSSKFFIPCCTTAVTIKYDADLANFQLNAATPCQDCKYDMQISVVNENTGKEIYHYPEAGGWELLTGTNTCAPSSPLHKVITKTLYLCGPANYTINRIVKPYSDGTTDLLSNTLTDYYTYLETHKADLLADFTTKYNTKTDYFVLRKRRAINYVHTYNDLCEVTSSVYTGIATGDEYCGNIITAKYETPVAVSKDREGNFYVLERDKNRIRKITTQGAVQQLAGSVPGGGFDDSEPGNVLASFNEPLDIVCRPFIGIGSDQFASSVIVADSYNNAVRMVNTTTGYTTTIATAADGLNDPHSVAVDEYGILYVVSRGNNRIYKLSLATGTPVLTRIASAYSFNVINDITVGKDGNLYVINQGTKSILKIDAGGTVSTIYTFTGNVSITSLAAASGGNFFVIQDADLYKLYPATATLSLVAGHTVTNNNLTTPAAIYADGGAIVYVPEMLLGEVKKVVIKDCMTTNSQNGIGWYPDKVELKPITDGSYTFDMINMDGRAEGSKKPGEEHYRLTGVSPAGVIPQEVQDDFIESYLRLFQVDMTGKINASSLLYTVNTGSELNGTIATMDEANVLNPTSMLDYYLLKLTYSDPSCEQACATPAPDACVPSCNEQEKALAADYFEAVDNLSKSTYKYFLSPLRPRVGLDIYVYENYPLNELAYSKLTEPDMELYNDYQSKREVLEQFNKTDCITACNGGQADICKICAQEYESGVFENMSNLMGGYNYLMSKWDASGSSTFPYTLSSLIHGTAPNTYNDANEEENLGTELFNYIVANINSSTFKTRSKWNEMGGSCSSCQSAVTSSPACPAGVPKDMRNFPSVLIPALEPMNASAAEAHTRCLKLNGDAQGEHDYLCQDLYNKCLEELGPEPAHAPPGSDDHFWTDWNTAVASCNTAHSNCVNNVSPNSVEQERKAMILEMLRELYILPSDEPTITTLTGQLYTQTLSMNTAQLEKFLTEYKNTQQCVLACRKQLLDAFDKYIKELKQTAADNIKEAFKNGCYNNIHESMDISYQESIYHYTLYNYDYGNNLVSTIPPDGIDYIKLDQTAEYTSSPRWSRVPQHRMVSTYKPTSLYDITTSTSDEGSTRYLYDQAGRLRFSQTAEQKERGQTQNMTIFSYVKYDNEYRVIESGEYRDQGHQIVNWSYELCGSCPLATLPKFYLSDRVNTTDWPNEPSNTFEETYIVYDNATLPVNTPSTAYKQTYLEERIAKTYNRDATTNEISSTTHYSYDGHGRVKFVVQEASVYAVGGSAYKTIDYDYKNLTSRVDQIIYQKGSKQEEFRHKFTYDNDYRITKAEVSRDGGVSWLPTVEYDYYLHGSLKRKGLGNKIQDMDYVYNINGWLKAINNPLTNSYANDGNESTISSNFAPDVFSEAINYYNGDYKRTGVGLDNTQKTVPQNGTDLFAYTKDLFTGNISSTVTNTAFNLTTSTADNILAQGYHYDYLNRLTDVYAEVKPENFTAFAYLGTGTDAYASHITYDPNGNIESFVRNSNLRDVPGVGMSTQMDNMTYKYAQTTMDYHGATKKTNNRLAHVKDDALSEYADDIKDQGTFDAGTIATHNYKYDAKGRIISDVKNGITEIKWTASDKVKQINKTDGSTILFAYTPQQQRLSKQIIPPEGGQKTSTIYSYDASNVLVSTYNLTRNSDVEFEYKLQDHQLYGMGRIGVYNVNEKLVISPTQAVNDASKLFFEITDHLGSVRAVVSGLKKIDGNADIAQLTDYHEFGMTMQGRSFTGKDYRFGYQGSEKDKEVDGGAYTTMFRALDVRLGKWFSPDPIMHPSWSPYASMNDNPIAVTDVTGLAGTDPPYKADGTRNSNSDYLGGTISNYSRGGDAGGYTWKPESSFMGNNIVGEYLGLMNSTPGTWLNPATGVGNYPGGPTAWEAALISQDVYTRGKGKLEGNWQRVHLDIDGVVWDDTGIFRSDFESALYRRELNNGTFEYVYATRGSEPVLMDWVENFRQFLFGTSRQYAISVNNARLIADYLKGESLTFVGHSLGGGLAIANSMATNKEAVVFNPPALSSATIDNNELGFKSKAKVWIVEGEVVTAVHGAIGVEAQGKSLHVLKRSFFQRKNLLTRVTGHFMDCILELMKAQGYEATSPQVKKD